METLGYVLLVAGSLLGLAGVFLPVLPGPTLVWASAMLFAWMVPGILSVWSLAILTVLMILGWAADYVSTLLGAHWLGASRWGILGAVFGALVGLFLFPFGLVLGPVLGAVLGELFVAKRHVRDASKAGLGAALGLLLAILAKLGFVLLMIALIFAENLFF